MTSKQRITINCCGVDAVISLPKGSSVYLRIEDVEFQFKSKKEDRNLKKELKELVALHREYKKQTKKAIEQLSELDDDEDEEYTDDDDEDMDLSEEGDDDVDSWCDEVIRLMQDEEEVEIQSGHIVLDI